MTTTSRRPAAWHLTRLRALREPGPGPRPPDDEAPPEREPDPRFTLANERTFLAWNRTALALVAAGLGVIELLPPFAGVPGGRHVLGIPLIVLGAALALGAHADMTRKQVALRRGQPLPRTVMPRVLAVSISAVAAASAVVVLVSASW